MEVIIFLIGFVGIAVAIGACIALAVGVFTILGYVATLLISLIFRFWYIALLILFVVVAPIIHLNHLWGYFFAGVGVYAVLILGAVLKEKYFSSSPTAQ